MIRPDELRLLANEWRNVAEAVRKLNKQAHELDVAGVNGALCGEHAAAQAAVYEETAQYIERTLNK